MLRNWSLFSAQWALIEAPESKIWGEERSSLELHHQRFSILTNSVQTVGMEDEEKIFTAFGAVGFADGCVVPSGLAAAESLPG